MKWRTASKADTQPYAHVQDVMKLLMYLEHTCSACVMAHITLTVMQSVVSAVSNRPWWGAVWLARSSHSTRLSSFSTCKVASGWEMYDSIYWQSIKPGRPSLARGTCMRSEYSPEGLWTSHTSEVLTENRFGFPCGKATQRAAPLSIHGPQTLSLKWWENTLRKHVLTGTVNC